MSTCVSAVQQWLDTLPSVQLESPSTSTGTPRPADLITPPASTSSNPKQQKRKRTQEDMAAARSQSPLKRQRAAPNDDVVYPEQSASEVAVTELSARTRLSQPSYSGRSSPKRPASPVRDLMNDLRVSTPSILCELPSTVALPEHVTTLHRQLMNRLEAGIIPLGLKDRILETYPSVAAEIPTSAYDSSSTLSAPELKILWDSVKQILDDSRDCGRYQKDENAWCLDVVHPVLRLALKESATLKVESVQTQSINPILLPTTPNSHRIQRKADYAFSFHRNAPNASTLYDRLGRAGIGDKLSQTTDANTRRLALFAGIEVKQENGGKDEALAQLAIWLAAGLENLRQLRKRGSLSEDTDAPEKLHPTVGWTVIGHDWYTYIVWMGSIDGMRVLNLVGPWRVAAADTRDVYGVFKLLRLVKNAEGFACKEYWDWLKRDVLELFIT